MITVTRKSSGRKPADMAPRLALLDYTPARWFCAERRQTKWTADQAYMPRGAVSTSALVTAVRNLTELHNRRPWASGLQRPEISAPSMLVVLAEQRGREMARSGRARNAALVQAPPESTMGDTRGKNVTAGAHPSRVVRSCC